MKNFRAGTFSGVLLRKIEKNILVEGKHPSILILRHLRRNSIFFVGAATVHVIPSPFRTKS